MFGPLTFRFVLTAALVLIPGYPPVLGGEKGMMGGEGGMMGGGHMKGAMPGHMKDFTSAEVPGIATEQLPEPDSEGAKLLLRYCAQCHNLPSPATHSSEEWPEVVDRMDAHMKASAGKGHREMMRIKRPTEPERKKIEDYLRGHALKPFTGKKLPDPDSPGGKLFLKICSGCHVLPGIGLHTPEEWPEVVERMRMNMKVLGKEGISGDDRDRIVDYLTRNAE